MGAELLWRAVADGVVICAVVWVLRRRGQRAAGLLAALPLLSAPALYTLSLHADGGHGVAAAIAALHMTGLTALLVLAYGLLRRELGPVWSLLLGAECTLAAAAWTHGIGMRYAPTLMLTGGIIVVARQALGSTRGDAAMCRFLRGYLDGLLVRGTFLAVLAPALAALDGWLAFPLAGGAAVVVLWIVTRESPAQGRGAVEPDDGGSATTLAERS